MMTLALALAAQAGRYNSAAMASEENGFGLDAQRARRNAARCGSAASKAVSSYMTITDHEGYGGDPLSPACDVLEAVTSWERDLYEPWHGEPEPHPFEVEVVEDYDPFDLDEG